MRLSITNEEKTDKKIHIWVRFLILLSIIAGISVTFYETGLIHFFLSRNKLIHFLDSLGPAAFLGFVFLQVAQVLVAPIPGEVTGLLGGFLYGRFLGIVLSTVGLTIGSYAAFVLSRIFGRPFVERFVSKFIIERFDYFLQRKGAFLAFFLFLIPGFPKDYFCYILGLGHLSSLEFLAISGTGRLFGTIFLTMGGNYLRNHQYQKFSILMGIALILFIIAMACKDKLESLFHLWQPKR